VSLDENTLMNQIKLATVVLCLVSSKTIPTYLMQKYCG
jgi:hypothetical protein